MAAQPETGPAEVAAICRRHGNRPDALIEILHDLQDRLGHVPRELLPQIAEALNLSRAEVFGTFSFYHDFRDRPAGRHLLQVCRAEACQAAGCEGVARHAQARLGIAPGETSADGAVTLKTVYCLGNCALGPAVMLDGRLHGRVTPERLDALLDATGRTATAGEGQGGPAGAALTLYLPRDAAALSAGADEVAAALAAEAAGRGLDLRLVRTGTRGALWLEPMLEVATDSGRIAYGPVSAADIPALFDAGLPTGGAHPLCLGDPAEIPFLADQQRLTFARCGVIDPLDLDDYRRHGGLAGLRAALALPPAEIVARVTASGLRGRGGAGFPAGIKWRTAAEAPSGPDGTGPKYIVCNADEGDSGTFADRILMEGDPSLLIEGMAIAGLAVGAEQGFVYIRSEYPHAIATMRAAIAAWEAAGLLGGDIDGSGRAFRLHLRRGAGAYICGEESSLLESLEGRRGQVRARPPIPAHAGLFGRPTVVNNVLTLAAVPTILADGAEAYAALGRGRSLGTQAFQLAGNIARGGLVELPFGVTLRTLVEGFGGGTRSGRPVRAVQVGGPLGAYLPAGRLDLPADYEALAEAGAMLGHGGITVFDDAVDMLAQARFAMAFCAVESCGKCTPCRLGAVRGTEVLDRMAAGLDPAGQRAVLEDLCEVMRDGSLCAMGGLTPMPVLSALQHFPEDFSGDFSGDYPGAAGRKEDAA